MYVVNTLVAWSSLFILLYFAAQLFIAWYGQNPYEWYAFAFTKAIGFVSWKWFFIKALLPLFFGLLFFCRKLRINRLMVIGFLLTGYLNLAVTLFSPYEDYLASSVSFTGAFRYVDLLSNYLIIVLLLAVIYFLAKKKNKLPYPSLFLK